MFDNRNYLASDPKLTRSGIDEKALQFCRTIGSNGIATASDGLAIQAGDVKSYILR